MSRAARKLPAASQSAAPLVPPGHAADLDRLHDHRLELIEAGRGPVLALLSEYPDGHYVPPHRHSRAQLLYARTGVVMVATGEGRWMVPPGHALWVPSEVVHSVEALGNVAMNSVYIVPDAVGGLPDGVRVVALTGLMQSLIEEGFAIPQEGVPGHREELVAALLLDEIPRLPARPLGLPFPAEPRLARLCRAFVSAPDPHLVIDDWAGALNMSRRAFTRLFRRETGLSLSLWRQQACLFTALPRLAAGEAVTSVALDLGYESVAAFTTMFTRMIGAPPRTYLGRGSA